MGNPWYIDAILAAVDRQEAMEDKLESVRGHLSRMACEEDPNGRCFKQPQDIWPEENWCDVCRVLTKDLHELKADDGGKEGLGVGRGREEP